MTLLLHCRKIMNAVIGGLKPLLVSRMGAVSETQVPG